MNSDINAFLREALASKGKIEIGQFQLLNLDMIKEKLGENWPSMRSKIFDAAAHFIEKRIGREDVFISCEEGFLIIFTDKEIDTASEVTDIGEELQKFFLGSTETEDIKVAGEVKAVDAKDLATISRPAAKPVAPESDIIAVAPAKPEPEPPAPTPRAAPAPKAYAEERVAPAFQPIWDAENQAVTGNIAFAKSKVGGRMIAGRRAIETGMRTDIEHLELDMAAIRGAMAGLMRIVKKKRKASLCLTPHISTFENETTRKEYLACLEGLPPPVRKAFMLHVDDLPTHDPAALGLLAEAREFGLRLVLEVPFGTEDVTEFESYGISVFSCKAPRPKNANSEGLLDHDQKALNSLARSARAVRAVTHLGDIEDLKTLKSAMAVGTRMFSGRAVLPDCLAPKPTAQLSMVDLYRMSKAA